LRSPFALVRLALKLVEPQLLGGGIRFSLRHRLRPYCVQVCWYSSCVSGAAPVWARGQKRSAMAAASAEASGPAGKPATEPCTD